TKYNVARWPGTTRKRSMSSAQAQKENPDFRLGQTVKKSLWAVWRAAALQMQSESGDMCGGFGSLAQQGFLTLFPAREAHRAERETVQILGKGRRRRTFSTR